MNEGGLANLFDKLFACNFSLTYFMCKKSRQGDSEERERKLLDSVSEELKTMHPLAKCLRKLQSKCVLDYSLNWSTRK